MQFTAKSGSPQKQRTGCLVVGVFEKGKLSPAAAAVDEACGGLITALCKSGDIKGKPGQTLLLHAIEGLAAERLLLVGCGSDETVTPSTYRKVLQAAAKQARELPAKELATTLTELAVADRDAAWKARQAVEVTGSVFYSYEETLGEKKKKAEDRPALKKVTLITASATETRQVQQGIDEGSAIALGMNLTRELGNLPGNICTPSYLAQQARNLARKYKSLRTVVLDEKEMERLGMGALLSVARGSRQPARLITMVYKGGAAADKPVVLVGKGLTFDSGGISIKPSAGMDEMKYDMCGGASVIGTMLAVAELGLPLNVVGVVPSSENLPDGAANKPGDVVTSMSGKTIEILNTDAEGRLILCDALTYSERFKPEVVIDVATLTGACVIALGKQATGLLGNDDALINDLLAAGQASGDRAWQLPLWEEYHEQLKSNFADLANVGGRDAGTITAASFLSSFTKSFRWAHLDIAGTAWNSGADKGATGRPVPLLMQYLIDRAGR